VTVNELLAHSTVIATMRYLHPNFAAEVQPIGDLAGDCDNPATIGGKALPIAPPLSQSASYLADYARIKNGEVGERLKPAVLKTVRLERVSGVRIPPSPPYLKKQK
jgi:hypothetical protein